MMNPCLVIFLFFQIRILESSSKDGQFRISHGRDIPFSEMPWMVRIETDFNWVLRKGSKRTAYNTKAQCAGALIGARTVLTAAHCVLPDDKPHTSSDEDLSKYDAIQEAQTGAVTVFLGSSSDAEQVALQVEDARAHKIFKKTDERIGDLAVLYFKSPNAEAIKKLKSLKKIKMLSGRGNGDERYIPGLTCMLAGWGWDETETNTKTLKGTEIPLKTAEECKNFLKTHKRTEELKTYPEDSFCSISQKGIGGCSGDSGAPLICKSPKKKEWILYGIFNNHVPSKDPIECGSKTNPWIQLFGDVSYGQYMKEIKECNEFLKGNRKAPPDAFSESIIFRNANI